MLQPPSGGGARERPAGEQLAGRLEEAVEKPVQLRPAWAESLARQSVQVQTWLLLGTPAPAPENPFGSGAVAVRPAHTHGTAAHLPFQVISYSALYLHSNG